MRLGWRGVLWLSVLAIVLAAIATLVLLRAPIGQAAALRVLSWAGIQANFKLAVLDLDRAVIEDLRVGPGARPGVAARRIEARYAFFGALRGRVREISAEGLEVRAAIDDQGVRIEGLPAGRGGGGRGRPARTPRVSIPDGRAFVATPAGELVADVVVAGGPDEGWSARLSAQPASLSRGADALELAAAVIEAQIADQELDLAGEVRLAALSHEGVTVRDAAAAIRFSGTYEDASRLEGLAGEGAASLSFASARLNAATSAAWAQRAAPTLSGASHEAAGPHLDALRGALIAALSELGADIELSVTFAEGEARIAPAGEAVIAAADGARLALASASDTGGGIVVDAATGVLRAHDLSISARLAGGIEARAIVSEASLRRGRTGAVGDVVATLAVAPWSAGDLTVAADVPRLDLGFGGGPWRLETQAEVRASGARFGVAAEDLAARLDLAITREASGFAARPRTDALQQVTAAHVTVAGRTFDDLSAGVAPFTTGGALLQVSDGDVSIETRLADASAGLEALGGRWASVLPAAELVMSFGTEEGDQVRAYVQAPRIEGRLPGGDAVIQAGVIEGAYVLEPARSFRLRFDGLSLGGAALPAHVEHAAGEITASLEDGRPYDGQVSLTGAAVTDTAELARLAPVTVGGDAAITGGVLAGALTAVDAGGRTIVRADVNHDFPSGRGALVVATPRFTFAPDSLQPGAVSPALIGPIVNVSGASQLQLRTAWGPQGTTASGLVELDRLAFDWRFGHVAGLSTRFEVADLLHVRTAAPQRIDIGLIDPGLPLENGALEIELLGPTRLRLASARFPFAEGVITAAPVEIDLTAERKLVLLLADRVSLEALHRLFNPPNLVLTGSLSGQIPVEARNRSVYVVDGELVSDGPGRVAYTGRAGEGIAQQNESTRLAFNALTNFQYDRLVLSIDGDVAGRLQADVRLEGRNPDVLEGYPINFNLNTSAEFADLLTQAFRGLSLSAAARGAEIENEP